MHITPCSRFACGLLMVLGFGSAQAAVTYDNARAERSGLPQMGLANVSSLVADAEPLEPTLATSIDQASLAKARAEAMASGVETVAPMWVAPVSAERPTGLLTQTPMALEPTIISLVIGGLGLLWLRSWRAKQLPTDQVAGHRAIWRRYEL